MILCIKIIKFSLCKMTKSENPEKNIGANV